MYQHPIPQNVTSYQFRLIGDLTLKQFLEFLIGVGLAVLFYLSNLYSPLKAVLMGASIVFGVALAFIPIEERPLDQWVIAFFKAIYHPTQFIWRKQPLLPEYFQYKVITATQSIIETSEANANKKQAGLSSFMQTLPVDDIYNNLDSQQSKQLQYVAGLFSENNQSKTDSIITESTTINQPTLEQIVSPQTNTTQETPLNESVFSTTITLPVVPSVANTVTGVIVSESGAPINNAIIEISDSQNTPIRATKTNRLGQFFSSTPLKNGTYSINIEADGYQSNTTKVEALGEIIQPLIIKMSYH